MVAYISWSNKGQTPKSDIPPNIAPKNVTPENYLKIWDSSATLIGQLAIVTLFGAILDIRRYTAFWPLPNKKLVSLFYTKLIHKHVTGDKITLVLSFTYERNRTKARMIL